MQSKIETKFTTTVAQNIYDLLTPSSTPGRSTDENVFILKRMKQDSGDSKVSMEDFLTGATPRSSLDTVESYNRIPCDRAQDAIVYFIEEILGLGEIDLSKAEKKKKTVWSDPEKQVDEETYAKHYLLFSDSDGVKYRLSISHTFLKVEVRTKRPNLTKTDKTGKPSYQMHWQPVRVKKRSDNSIVLVNYPVKKIVINNATRKSSTQGDEAQEKEWESAFPIGKRNLVDLAIDLRTECALSLFDNKPLHESLKDAHITKYFFMLNELIKQDARVDVIEGVAKKKQSKEEQQVEIAQPIADLGVSEFTDKFELVSCSFDTAKTPTPAFRLDVYDENFVLQMIIDHFTEKKPNASDIERTKSVLEDAMNLDFPASTTVFHTAYRSIFMFPAAIFLKANALRKIEIKSVKTRKTQKANQTQFETTYEPVERSKISFEKDGFSFRTENFEKGSVFFSYSTEDLAEDVAFEDDLRNFTQKHLNMAKDKLYIAGGMYFDFNFEKQRKRVFLQIYITHIYHSFDEDHSNLDEIMKQAKNFVDFVTCWKNLYLSDKIVGMDVVDGVLIIEDDELETNCNPRTRSLLLDSIMGFDTVLSMKTLVLK